MAVIGVAVAIGGTAYSIYSQEQAASAANSARPKAFVPIDINKVAGLAKDADVSGYQISDFDWARRFPQLKAGRDYTIGDAAGNLSGKMSPTVTSEMNKAGLGADLGDNQFAQARNLGLPITSLQQRNRNYFQNLLARNPQRTAGLSGQDVTRIGIANTGPAQNYNQGIFQSRIGQYNAQVAQGINNTNAAISGLGALAGLIPSKQTQSPYTDPFGTIYNKEAVGFGRTG